MTDKLDPKRLDALEEKLAQKRAPKDTGKKHEDHYSGAQQGWRMVTELVVGLVMGFGIGYALDYWLNTQPWFMIIFTMIGFAGGVRAMMRSAEEIQKKNSKLAPDQTPAGNKEMYDDD